MTCIAVELLIGTGVDARSSFEHSTKSRQHPFILVVVAEHRVDIRNRSGTHYKFTITAKTYAPAAFGPPQSFAWGDNKPHYIPALSDAHTFKKSMLKLPNAAGSGACQVPVEVRLCLTDVLHNGEWRSLEPPEECDVIIFCGIK